MTNKILLRDLILFVKRKSSHKQKLFTEYIVDVLMCAMRIRIFNLEFVKFFFQEWNNPNMEENYTFLLVKVKAFMVLL